MRSIFHYHPTSAALRRNHREIRAHGRRFSAIDIPVCKDAEDDPLGKDPGGREEHHRGRSPSGVVPMLVASVHVHMLYGPDDHQRLPALEYAVVDLSVGVRLSVARI